MEQETLQNIIEFCAWMLVPLALAAILWYLTARQAWLRQTLIAAGMLCAALSVIWLWIPVADADPAPNPNPINRFIQVMIVNAYSEDVTVTYWTDYIFFIIMFLTFFPTGLLFGDPSNAKVAEMAFCLSADSFFWGLIVVVSIRALRRCLLKRQTTRGGHKSHNAVNPRPC